MAADLNKLFALILWADEKVTKDEMGCLEGLHSKYGFSIDSVRSEIESLLGGTDVDDNAESEQPLLIGSVDLDGIDEFELLSDLARIAVSDKEINFREISILHEIGASIGSDPTVVTAALLSAVINSNGISLSILNGEGA